MVENNIKTCRLQITILVYVSNFFFIKIKNVFNNFRMCDNKLKCLYQ